LLSAVFFFCCIYLCAIVFVVCLGAFFVIVVGSYLGLQALLGDVSKVAAFIVNTSEDRKD
jgi:hypothetical protein